MGSCFVCCSFPAVPNVLLALQLGAEPLCLSCGAQAPLWNGCRHLFLSLDG